MLIQLSGERGTQDVLVRAATRTAAGEFAVNHNGRHAADAVLLRLGSNFGLLHVVEDYLVRTTRQPLDELDCLLASRTAGTEDFDLLSRCHVFSSSNALKLSWPPESVVALIVRRAARHSTRRPQPAFRPRHKSWRWIPRQIY